MTNEIQNIFSDQPAAGDSRALIQVEQQRAIAEVQARMLIARANPRNERQCMDLILQDCMRPSLANEAIYQYARGGTDIEGPSIRLAEAVARRWGNIASGIKEVSRQHGCSECVAYAWDLETGYYDERQFQVRHWRDTKGGGYALKDERDIYELTANMGQRRKRAVLLAVLPSDVVSAAREQCALTLKTHTDVSPEAIAKMVESFAQIGVTRKQIEDRIQRRAEAITAAQVVNLRKIFVSLRDEMSRPEDWFKTNGQVDAQSQPQPGKPTLASALQNRHDAMQTHDTEAKAKAKAPDQEQVATTEPPGRQETQQQWPLQIGPEAWVDSRRIVRFDGDIHGWSVAKKAPSVTKDGVFTRRRGCNAAAFEAWEDAETVAHIDYATQPVTADEAQVAPQIPEQAAEAQDHDRHSDDPRPTVDDLLDRIAVATNVDELDELQDLARDFGDSDREIIQRKIESMRWTCPDPRRWISLDQVRQPEAGQDDEA